jgi:hypothetical protein
MLSPLRTINDHHSGSAHEYQNANDYGSPQRQRRHHNAYQHDYDDEDNIDCDAIDYLVHNGS